LGSHHLNPTGNYKEKYKRLGNLFPGPQIKEKGPFFGLKKKPLNPLSGPSLKIKKKIRAQRKNSREGAKPSFAPKKHHKKEALFRKGFK